MSNLVWACALRFSEPTALHADSLWEYFAQLKGGVSSGDFITDDWIPNLQRLCLEGGNHSGRSSDPTGHTSMSCQLATGISNLRAGAGVMGTASKTANDFVVPCKSF